MKIEDAIVLLDINSKKENITIDEIERKYHEQLDLLDESIKFFDNPISLFNISVFDDLYMSKLVKAKKILGINESLSRREAQRCYESKKKELDEAKRVLVSLVNKRISYDYVLSFCNSHSLRFEENIYDSSVIVVEGIQIDLYSSLEIIRNKLYEILNSNLEKKDFINLSCELDVSESLKKKYLGNLEDLEKDEIIIKKYNKIKQIIERNIESNSPSFLDKTIIEICMVLFSYVCIYCDKYDLDLDVIDLNSFNFKIEGKRIDIKCTIKELHGMLEEIKNNKYENDDKLKNKKSVVEAHKEYIIDLYTEELKEAAFGSANVEESYLDIFILNIINNVKALSLIITESFVNKVNSSMDESEIGKVLYECKTIIKAYIIKYIEEYCKLNDLNLNLFDTYALVNDEKIPYHIGIIEIAIKLKSIAFNESVNKVKSEISMLSHFLDKNKII